MPRRRVAEKRDILPDPKFGSEQLTKFINVVMKNGKKSIAEKIVYGALDIVAKQSSSKQTNDEDEDGEEGGSTSLKPGVLDTFKEALDNVRPRVEVRSRRVGGATYQIPVEVKPQRSMALAMRWLVQAARGRREKGMMHRLASEILEAASNRGTAVKKREDTHRMADANKAFAHFSWT